MLTRTTQLNYSIQLYNQHAKSTDDFYYTLFYILYKSNSLTTLSIIYLTMTKKR